MNIEPATKKYIDGLTYEDMLRMNRTAPIGFEMFQGDVGKYFFKVMGEKRILLTHEQQVAASKNIGWD